jgi:hypothetical protein
MSKRLLKLSKDKEARKNRVEALTNDMEGWFEHFLAYVTKDERNVEKKKGARKKAIMPSMGAL